MKSIGKVLKAARLKNNLTIEAVKEQIKIHPKYIKAMEEDDYSQFNGKVHSKGFLKVYANFLDLEETEILALWRREYEPSFKETEELKYKLGGLEPSKFLLTPSFMLISFLSVAVFLFFVYLFFQYRQYTDAPTLDIYFPQDNLVVSSDVLDITGKVELDSEVFINNQRIIANPDGTFLTSVKLREGINTFSIKAINRINKETEQIRNVIYRPVRVEVPEQVEEVEESTPAEEEVVEAE